MERCRWRDAASNRARPWRPAWQELNGGAFDVETSVVQRGWVLSRLVARTATSVVVIFCEDNETSFDVERKTRGIRSETARAEYQRGRVERLFLLVVAFSATKSGTTHAEE